jgi:hypothetical protein
LLNLETFAGKLGMTLVDCRKRCGKVAAMKRLYDR